jgi:NAD(P)-dependent dehydrogenase (short-subunit alcohol dehydrogenase family)
MRTDLFDLQGKKALIVGACGYIGRSLCHGLALSGADLLIADLRDDVCQSLVKDLSSTYAGKYVYAAADCSTEQGIQSIMKMCDAAGPTQIVIHCIGLISSVPIPGYAVPFEEQSLDAWDAALKANLTSAFLLAKHVNKHLDRANGASVIFLSSIYGSFGPDWSLYENTDMGNPLAYGASKGGLQQLMRYLSTLWAPKVRVNCVSPGGLRRGQDIEFIRKYENRTPLRRMAEPQDIVGPVIFLAADASRYITGQNIMVDGGWSAW